MNWKTESEINKILNKYSYIIMFSSVVLECFVPIIKVSKAIQIVIVLIILFIEISLIYLFYHILEAIKRRLP